MNNTIIPKLVTILTPVYNGATLIHRLLDSVLAQTYEYVSMVIINDGSTDDTGNIIENYIPKFQERGYSLVVHNQVNLGLGATINNGLKYVTGEYLVWPDADDWYASPEAIEKLVSALSQSGDDVGVARCAYNFINEEDMEIANIAYPRMGNNPVNIFEKAVKGDASIWFAPGGWMIKTKFLDTLIPKREIYHSKLGGQNPQILWPYLYEKKCISVEEPLFSYLIRANSHSRGLFGDLDIKLKQQDEYAHTYEVVLSGIGLAAEKINSLLENRRKEAMFNKLVYCIKAKNYTKLRQCYKEYKQGCREKGYINTLSAKLKIKFSMLSTPIICYIFSFLLHLYRLVMYGQHNSAETI